MTRAQLAHLLRASSEIAGDPHILVIGSQAILGTFDEDLLPAPATVSREVDIAFLDDPGSAKTDLLDGAIGELSPFDEQFGYYAQGVHRLSGLPVRPETRDRISGFLPPGPLPTRSVEHLALTLREETKFCP